jgi:hypothetical protein
VIPEAPKQGRALMQPGAAPAVVFRLEVEITTGFGAVAGAAAIPHAFLGVNQKRVGDYRARWIAGHADEDRYAVQSLPRGN